MSDRKFSGSDKWTPIAGVGVKVIHPFKENIAYGNTMIPVLERQIVDQNPDQRKRALQRMKLVLRKSENVACLSEDDAIRAIHQLAKDPDGIIRKLLAQVLVSITSTAVGRQYFIDNLLVNQALDMLDDEDSNVRRNVLQSLRQIVHIPTFAAVVADAGGIEKIVARLAIETMVLNQEPALRILHFCILKNPKPAIEAGALKQVVRQLRSFNPKIRENAAECLFDLTIDRETRLKALKYKVVPFLLTQSENITELKAATKSIAALMMIVNSTPGKLEAIEHNALTRLLLLLKETDFEFRLNCLQTLTILAEAPEGRRVLQENIGKLMALKLDPSRTVQRFVKRAINVIQSQPI